MTASLVDPADIEAFRADGAVCLRGAIPTTWLAVLAEGVERNLREPGPKGGSYTPDGKPGRFFGDYCNWDRIPEYRRFMTESPAAAVAGALMGSAKVNVYHEHLLVKEPGTSERTPWHQDQPYYPIDGRDVVSLWIPLDPVAREVTLEFVAGSHASGVWYRPKRFKDGEDHAAVAARFEPVPDIEGDRERFRILGWATEPGDVVAFHALTLHGAPGNSSGERRRAFSARWTGDDARFVPREGYMSPPPPETGGPIPGAVMDSEAFPVVWRA